MNATFSCTEAYTSRFGAFAGVPVALLGLLYFAMVLGLIALQLAIKIGVRQPVPAMSSRCRRSDLAAVSLPCVFVLLHSSRGVPAVRRHICRSDWIVPALRSRDPVLSDHTSSRLARDFRLLISGPGALAATVMFLVAAGVAIAMFPERRVTAASADSPEAEQARAPAPVCRAAETDGGPPGGTAWCTGDGARRWGGCRDREVQRLSVPWLWQTYRDVQERCWRSAAADAGQGQVHHQGLPARAASATSRWPGYAPGRL